MGQERLAAFSDGVIAIIITIMVLELKTPHGVDLAALSELGPVFLSYALSFIYVAIYWNNHHHLLHTAQRINGSVLWANMHLLFWLSLIPFATAWTGENQSAALPTAFYGIILLLAAIAYYVLQQTIIHADPSEKTLATALGRDLKGKLSPLCYLSAIGLAFIAPWLANAVYIGVAILWLVPDRRIEKSFAAAPDDAPR